VVPVTPPHVTSEEGPAAGAPRRVFPTRFAAVVGVAVAVFALLAIVLAALAPALDGNQASYVPSGWGTVFDGAPVPGDQWEDRGGCTFVDGALRVDSSAPGGSCRYQPSASRDLVSGGVYVQATVAPSASVPGNEDAGIFLGSGDNRIVALVDESGVYRVCTSPCDGTAAVYAAGETVAWHANGYTENVIALRYLPDSQALTLYVNGQEVQTVLYRVAPGSEIAVGTSQDSEALFTHLSISTGPTS
jgi:hypothetical protein